MCHDIHRWVQLLGNRYGFSTCSSFYKQVNESLCNYEKNGKVTKTVLSVSFFSSTYINKNIQQISKLYIYTINYTVKLVYFRNSVKIVIFLAKNSQNSVNKYLLWVSFICSYSIYHNVLFCLLKMQNCHFRYFTVCVKIVISLVKDFNVLNEAYSTIISQVCAATCLRFKKYKLHYGPTNRNNCTVGQSQVYICLKCNFVVFFNEHVCEKSTFVMNC